MRSDLVLINALVTDRRGGAIAGLDASRFRLLENGKERVVQYCISEDAPVSIGLILDTGGGMGVMLRSIRQAALQFVRAGNPDDDYFVIHFRDHPEIAVPYTADPDEIAQGIVEIGVGRSKTLFDAVHLAVDQMRRAKNPRRALLIISDGLNSHSRYTQKETMKLISEVEFPIYSINLYQRPTSGNRYAVQRRDPVVLETLSSPTGGRSVRVRSLSALPAVTKLIASEIRHEYVLGYVPTDSLRGGKYRSVRVKVVPAGGERLLPR